MVSDEEHNKLKEEYLDACHELGELKERYSLLKKVKNIKDDMALKETEMSELRNG